MKLKGKKIELGRNSDIIVIPRGDERFVFKAEALLNYREFDLYCPEPKPPIKLLPGGRKEPQVNSPKYEQDMQEYATKRIHYTIIKSLEATEDLEWEGVDIKEPTTWYKWEKELEEAGFSQIERQRIQILCMQVNGLDDGMLSAAKEDFLAGAPQQDQ